ncbi:MAG: radical SAM protein, partial [Crenarchaeota archaeon]|nr:radical SAM protein [Thermoproteota archaeon]
MEHSPHLLLNSPRHLRFNTSKCTKIRTPNHHVHDSASPVADNRGTLSNNWRPPVKKTKSICPVCQKKIDAELTEADGKILITKKCKEHGTFFAAHWQSSSIFKFSEKFDFFKDFGDANSPENPDGCPYICESCNNHASDTVIGVIDVTKRCDLNCAICFSTFPQHEVDYEPSKDAIVKMLEFLSKVNPKPPAILFSGGEPLERDDMHEIVGVAHKLRFMTILATNGIQ